MWTRRELKAKAQVAFKANYWVSVLAAFVISFFTAAGGSQARNQANNSDLSDVSLGLILAVVGVILVVALVIWILEVIFGYSLTIGAHRVFIMNETSEEKPRAGEILSVFKTGNVKNVAITMLVRDIFIVLWTLLLVVPGVIKSYEYRMVPFLLAENPAMNRNEAFAASKQMMNGNKWATFVLDLSFLGWAIVGAITCGIAALFYVAPYVNQTNAELYLTLKEKSNY